MRLAVFATLLAALWLTTAQAFEISHLHGWQDSYEQCLTCQADTGSAVESLGPTQQVPAVDAAIAVGTIQQVQRQFLTTPPARGPPAVS